jgi:molecular chaperone GrpE
VAEVLFRASPGGVNLGQRRQTNRRLGFFGVVDLPAVRTPDDKGKFNTGIGQDVIDAALKSVAKHSGEPAATAVPAESAPAETSTTPDAAAPAAPPAPASSDPKDKEIEDLKMQLEFSMAKGRELNQKIRDEHDKMLRAVADLENYKKRALKEKEEVQKFGVEKLLKDFLPVIDNVDRALEHAKSPADYESLKKGVEMIRRLFEDTLGKYNVKSFSAKGKPFDPNLHEAMSAAETNELPPNHVYADVLRGFTLNDRLVRPALVVVSRTPAAPATAPTQPPPSSGGDGSPPSTSGAPTS